MFPTSLASGLLASASTQRCAYGGGSGDLSLLVMAFASQSSEDEFVPTQRPAERAGPPGPRRADTSLPNPLAQEKSGSKEPRHQACQHVIRETPEPTMRMHMRRFTRLTNGFSKKVEAHANAVALHFMYYNFIRIHASLRMTRRWPLVSLTSFGRLRLSRRRKRRNRCFAALIKNGASHKKKGSVPPRIRALSREPTPRSAGPPAFELLCLRKLAELWPNAIG